ncbi:MAG: serine/threonine protein phosphatase [Candidatus Abyssobacteria bacterium SURF_17]|uniref:Serine/threonine protein phosphatase n=1 Tax=Candidatus Abyssobacteria bacterium SURF_17 TaxID=2093361 RepID=A0A419EXR6_9BACT|nr:MAG: serine/threonine protein phosphatase [Candidatus Abyssubacteria bacterium SURF_17]
MNDTLANESPSERKIFAVGDIHGNYEKLVSLMSQLPRNRERDLLVFLGDYIDRGKRSKEVVEYLITLKKSECRTVFLMGNHERLLLNYYSSGSDYDLRLWRSFGGWETIESYTNGVGVWGKPNFLPHPHLNFFRELLPYYETEDYIFVHAGLRDGVPLNEQKIDDLLWIRKSFTEGNHSFAKTVVFGHTPMRSPYVSSGKIGIDTGAGYGNMLTAVELPEVKFYYS